MKKFLLLIAISAAMWQTAKAADSTDILWQKNLNASAFAFHPNTTYLAVAYGGGVSLRNIQTGDELQNIKEVKNDGAISLSFSKDGKYLAGGSNKGRIFVWNTETWEETVVDEIDGGTLNSSSILGLEFSPDSKYLAAAAREYGVRIYDTKDYKLIKDIKDLPVIHTKFGDLISIEYISVSFDSKKIAYSNSATTFVYDMEKDSVILRIDGSRPKFSPVRNELFVVKIIYQGQQQIIDGLDLYRTFTQDPDEHIDFAILDYHVSNDGNFLIRFGDYPPNVDIIDIKNRSRKFTFKYINDYSFGYAVLDNSLRYMATVSGILFLIDLKSALGINELQSIQYFNVFPNPSKNSLTINYSLTIQGHIEINISNLVGNSDITIKSEFQAEGNHSEIYPTTDMPSGTYFVTLKINNKIYSQKINIVR